MEENHSSLHKIFVDLSLENDLRGEELDWFKTKIIEEKEEGDVKDQKSVSVSFPVDIISANVVETLPEKTEKLFLKLSETNTIWIFSLGTYFSQNDINDAEKVRKENETYKMKKTKKELLRKRCMADAQTPRCMVKSRGTLTNEINMKETGIFASEWDLYDTYNAIDKCKMSKSKKFLKFLDSSKTKETESSCHAPAEEQVTTILRSEGFRYASLVTERLLASNCFQNEQSIFKMPFKSRYSEDPTLYSYEVQPLWSFQKDFKRPLMVTDMDWNPLNEDLLAVGYGDLSFQKTSAGLICIWSPKNPRQPEKEFWFKESVTSLHYSRTRPNILGVGTRQGNVYVLDVASQTGNIRSLGSGNCKSRPEPIWKVEWFLHKELFYETEELLTVGESGVLMCFSFSNDKETSEILKLNYVTSVRRLSNKKIPKKSSKPPPKIYPIYDKKTFSGLWFSIYSNRNFCYVSTKEGVVVKCNLRNPSMLDEILQAHNGPVYIVQHSPATDLVFFTCGADWTIKIWMEGINQPLITLQHKAPVICAMWSPTIPTLVASVGETEISLWDISRNVLSPMSVKSFEDCDTTFTTLLFSSNGQNIVVGGQDALVRVVHLSQLPRIPFLQKEALISAIRKGLFGNQELISKFRRAVDMNKEKLITKVVV